MSYKIKSISNLYNEMYIYLLKEGLRMEEEMAFHSCDEMTKPGYRGGIDDRRFNLVRHNDEVDGSNFYQLEEIVLTEIFPEYAEEHNGLLKKLERIEAMLEATLQKFVDKIDLIQSKEL